MNAPLRIEHLSPCRAGLLRRRHMKFILVNGRTPRLQSFCARCGEPIGASYLREITTRLALYCDHECLAGKEICRARRGSDNGERMLP